MARIAQGIGIYLMVSMILSACGDNVRRSPPALETTEDFLSALWEAGAIVAETALLGMPNLGINGQVFQVNDGLVHVYEYESEAQRTEVSETISTDGSIGGTRVEWSDRPNIWAVSQLIVVYSGTDGGLILLLDGLLGDPITEFGSSSGEPYPPGVTAAVQYLAEELAVDPSEVVMVHYEAVNWSNTCLGLTAPEEMCVDIVTPGWRVLLRVDQMEYELHTDDLGTNIRIKVQRR